MFPNFADTHEIINDEPEEELSILAAGHASAQYGQGQFPAYKKWYTAADHTGGYRLFRRYLQAMQAGRPGRARWLLKCPSHLEMLRPLLTVFDDATVVLTHRDPVSCIVSLAALSYFSTGMFMRRPWLGIPSWEWCTRPGHSTTV
ncbi:hypothetical protein HNP84_005391 [Thermocatellispora tengchongensis]|uniref:Sulfotransferase n=2 Tax=Thermocatellispora tengchongensis TaxID=1073253 RepID=A0A840PER7_9ACTN|nr:hypothetical protein [Thermocatellispora tengchongensis]